MWEGMLRLIPSPCVNFTFFVTNCRFRVYALARKFDIIVKIKME